MEAKAMKTAKLDTNALFTQYMNVVNRAIGEHRDEFPYKQLMKAGQKVLGDKNIGVAIYKDNPKTPHDWFTIRYGDGTFEIVNHGKEGPEVSWRIDQDHLRNVVNNPQPFVDKPVKLDLDWLKTRFDRN